jgi:hypothetical protein
MDNLYFWGIFLLVAGATLLAGLTFRLKLPVLKILAGTLIILAGLKIVSAGISPSPLWSGKNEIFLRSAEVSPAGELPAGYQLVFSRIRLDLENMEIPDKVTELSINSIFSGSRVYLPSGVPVIIRVEGIFAGIKMPGINLPLLGRGSYSSAGFDPGLPHLDIRVNIIFGNIAFMYKI